MAVNTNHDTPIHAAFEDGHLGAVRPSFDELYATRYAPMIRLASLLVDTVDESEKVVQDALHAI